MKKFSTIFLGATILFLLLWQIPWLYSFITPSNTKTPFVLYSPVSEDFTFTGIVDNKSVHTDASGRVYSQREIDSLHPVFYGRQLMSDGRFPDSIAGRAVSYKETQNDMFYFRHSPREMNAPQIGLYQLLESKSGRVKLESSSDVFRITGRGIEFVEAQTNTLNREKSDLFTAAMTKKGFAFPACELSGNPSVKKDYDEGYLVLDAERKLYHLKQVKGRPYVRNIELPAGVRAEHVFITEFRNRETLGFMTDDQNRFYAIMAKDYTFRQLDIPSFDPENNSLMIYGMVFQWTLKVSSKQGVTYYVLNGDDFSLIRTFEEIREESVASKIGECLSKIGITFTDPLDKFVYPRIGG